MYVYMAKWEEKNSIKNEDFKIAMELGFMEGWKKALESTKLHLPLADVISRFSIEERFRLEEKLVKMITDKRPYYKTVKKREVVRDTVSDLLDAIIQNGV